MKTLLTALRATIFGTGFILLWRWVALGLHRRYDTALGFVVYRQFHHAFGLRPVPNSRLQFCSSLCRGFYWLISL
jgi:hypothetical protein